MQREPEDQLRLRRHFRFAAGHASHAAQAVLDGAEDLVRIEIAVAHDLREEIPFDLRKRDEQMFVREKGVFAPARGFDGAVDDALGAVTNLAGGDVEVEYVHFELRRLKYKFRPLTDASCGSNSDANDGTR